MSGEPLGEDARAFVAEMAEEEGRVVLRCRPYSTFAQPPRHLHQQRPEHSGSPTGSPTRSRGTRRIPSDASLGSPRAALTSAAGVYLFIGAGHDGFWRNSLFLGQENNILERMEMAPWLVSVSPTLAMLIGVGIAYYMYMIDRTAPQRLASDFPGLYRFLIHKWYFDELYDFLFAVLPSLSAACSGRAATARSSTALDRTASRRAFSTSPVMRAPADGLRLSLRVRDAAWRGGADDLVSVRRSH